MGGHITQLLRQHRHEGMFTSPMWGPVGAFHVNVDRGTFQMKNPMVHVPQNVLFSPSYQSKIMETYTVLCGKYIHGHSSDRETEGVKVPAAMAPEGPQKQHLASPTWPDKL